MFDSFSYIQRIAEKREEEEIGATAMKNHYASSKNRLFWLRKGNFLNFFVKAEGLISSTLLKKQSPLVSGQR